MLRDRTLLLLAALSLLAWLAAWGLAYTPHSCHEATWLYKPPNTSGPLICDTRLGHKFVFRRDGFQNWLAMLGWVISYLLVTWLIARRLYRRSFKVAMLIFNTLAGGLLWLLLVLSFDRSGYGCAFGFGGFACTTQLGKLGLEAIFGGWLIPVLALAATIVLLYS